jgi:hypothetical protein
MIQFQRGENYADIVARPALRRAKLMQLCKNLAFTLG